MMNYTKGDWKVAIARYKNKFPSIHIYREEASQPIIGDGTGKVICQVCNTDSPEAAANAHLIAAAPELYEVSKWIPPLIKFIGSLPSKEAERLGSDIDYIKAQAEQAIAKAEGGK